MDEGHRVDAFAIRPEGIFGLVAQLAVSVVVDLLGDLRRRPGWCCVFGLRELPSAFDQAFEAERFRVAEAQSRFLGGFDAGGEARSAASAVNEAKSLAAQKTGMGNFISSATVAGDGRHRRLRQAEREKRRFTVFAAAEAGEECRGQTDRVMPPSTRMFWPVM